MNSEKTPPKTLDEKVDAILRILQGEPMDPADEGLMGTVRFLKKELYKILNWKSRVIAWVGGLSFGGGALITYIISRLLQKH